MAKLKTCKHCGKRIAKNAKKCPSCGGSNKSILALLLVPAIIVFIIVGISVGIKEDEETKQFTHEVTKEYNDSFTHYVEGTVKNENDREYSYVQIEFVCYDKQGNNVGTALDNTNNLLGNQTWKFKAIGLFTDQKVDHCDFHEITAW